MSDPAARRQEIEARLQKLYETALLHYARLDGASEPEGLAFRAVFGSFWDARLDASLEAHRLRSELRRLDVGEGPGHPFRGNQYQQGQGGGESLTDIRARARSHAKDEFGRVPKVTEQPSNMKEEKEHAIPEEQWKAMTAKPYFTLVSEFDDHLLAMPQIRYKAGFCCAAALFATRLSIPITQRPWHDRECCNAGTIPSGREVERARRVLDTNRLGRMRWGGIKPIVGFDPYANLKPWPHRATSPQDLEEYWKLGPEKYRAKYGRDSADDLRDDALPGEFDETKHPRGQPKNKGQFASKPGGGTSGPEDQRPGPGRPANEPGPKGGADEQLFHIEPENKAAGQQGQNTEFPKGKSVPPGENKSEEQQMPDVRRTTDEWIASARRDWFNTRKAYMALPIEVRDRHANVNSTVPERIAELLDPKGHKWEDTGDVKSQISSRVGSFAADIPDEGRTRITEMAHGLVNTMRELKFKDEDIQAIGRHITDHLIAQDMEAQGRTLGDHGIYHIKMDADLAKQILAKMPGGYDTPRNRFMMDVVATYHDVAYLTPPSRNFLDKDHARHGATYFFDKVAPLIEKALGEDGPAFTKDAFYAISNHQDTQPDWEGRPFVAAFSTADNLALFHEEKIPPMFRYVHANTQVAIALGRGKIDVNEAKGRMRANIEATHLSAPVKQRLLSAVDEVTDRLPTHMVGMLGAKIDKIQWDKQKNCPLVQIKRGEANIYLSKVIDAGRQQFAKVVEDYGKKGAEHDLLEKGRLELTDKSGVTRLELVVINTKRSQKKKDDEGDEEVWRVDYDELQERDEWGRWLGAGGLLQRMMHGLRRHPGLMHGAMAAANLAGAPTVGGEGDDDEHESPELPEKPKFAAEDERVIVRYAPGAAGATVPPGAALPGGHLFIPGIPGPRKIAWANA